MDQNDALNGQDTAAEENQEAEEQNEIPTMESLLEQADFSLDLPRQGEIRTGMIASISGDEILVSIGAKSEGVIPSRELEQLSKEEREGLKVGMEIPVFVISPENRQGTLFRRGKVRAGTGRLFLSRMNFRLPSNSARTRHGIVFARRHWQTG